MSGLTPEQQGEATALRVKERVTNAENFFGAFFRLVRRVSGETGGIGWPVSFLLATLADMPRVCCFSRLLGGVEKVGRG